MDAAALEVLWIEVGGVAIHTPVTSLTNLVLAAQCGMYTQRLSTAGTQRGVLWGHFFLAMAFATAAGAVKHGVPHLIPPAGFECVLWISNLAGGIATWFAQRATIASRAPRRRQEQLTLLVHGQLCLYVAANVVVGPELVILLLDTALGLLPVVAVEAVSFLDGKDGAGRVGGGLLLSLMTGAVYLTEVSVGPWLSHVDTAHLMMMVSFALIVRGAPGEGSVRTPGYGGRGGAPAPVPETGRS